MRWHFNAAPCPDGSRGLSSKVLAQFCKTLNVEYIYTLLRPQVSLYCLVEEAMSPFGGVDVHKLHITGVGS